jgi:hypothetical protein
MEAITFRMAASTSVVFGRVDQIGGSIRDAVRVVRPVREPPRSGLRCACQRHVAVRQARGRTESPPPARYQSHAVGCHPMTPLLRRVRNRSLR